MILIFKTKKIDHCEERVVKCNTVMQFKMQWKPLNLLSEKEKKRERAEAFEQLRINALGQRRTEMKSYLNLCQCAVSL